MRIGGCSRYGPAGPGCDSWSARSDWSRIAAARAAKQSVHPFAPSSLLAANVAADTFAAAIAGSSHSCCSPGLAAVTMPGCSLVWRASSAGQAAHR